MRLKVSLRPHGNMQQPNKHAVQGFVYDMLRGTEHCDIHDSPVFKFFTFSDFFMDSRGRWTFIISSPQRGFIKAVYSNLKERREAYIGKEKLHVEEIKTFELRLKRCFQTGSPIVLYRDADRNEYFKLHRHRDLRFFLERLKENAEKKYNSFYGDEFHLEEPLFDRLIPKVRKNGKLDVYVKVRKGGKSFAVIGSNWELLEKESIPRSERRFYRFVMDAGVGEKNSLGFGFLNPIRR